MSAKYEQKTKVNLAIGQRIRELREEAELSRHRLGLMVEAAGNQINDWENGVSPSLYFVVLLCEALDVSPNYLLTGRDEW